jgi:hypothetical protein
MLDVDQGEFSARSGQTIADTRTRSVGLSFLKAHALGPMPLYERPRAIEQPSATRTT